MLNIVSRDSWWKQQKRKESNDTISEQTGKPRSPVAVKTTSCRGFRSIIKPEKVDTDVVTMNETTCRGFRSVVPVLIKPEKIDTDVVTENETTCHGSRSVLIKLEKVDTDVVTENDHMIPTPTDLSISDNSSSEHDDDEVTSRDERICTNNSDPVIIDSKQKRRYILFLGNLSVDATEEEILTHFKKKGVVIKELRLLTYKDTGKSRGCGFAEFVDDRTMKNALKFHRSKLKGKFVNIEVTCGGGGKGDQRKAKIEKKNRRQRIARAKKSKFKTPQEI